MDPKIHWENVYSTKSPDNVSWFQPHAKESLRIINDLKIAKSSHLLDVGAGASTLVDDLFELGYSNLSVLDLSAAALRVAQDRMGEKAKQINWLEENVTELNLAKHSVDLWHDRAVFHFLTNQQDRDQYVETVVNAVKPGGFVIVATFDQDGPTMCSGLPVQRYSADDLHAQFGSPFKMLGHRKELHQTPFGTSQSFVYCYCRVAELK